MENIKFILVLVGFVLTFSIDISVSKDAALETVSKHGKLSVDGVFLVNEDGEKVQLKGMSLFWDVWSPDYYNNDTVNSVRDYCHSNVIRAAIAVETEYNGGYIENPEESLERLYTIIDAAIENDIYVIVDWHDSDAIAHQNYSVEFFDTVSKKYSGVPNLIYETFNEPLDLYWTNDLKPYHETVINTIRANDPDSVIIVGTPNWCLDVRKTIYDPFDDQINIMYTFRFSAATHGSWNRDRATEAITYGIPIFVTGYTTVHSDFTGPVNVEESELWFTWLDENNIPNVNWAINDKPGDEYAIIADTPPSKVCQEDYLTESGKLVVTYNKS